MMHASFDVLKLGLYIAVFTVGWPLSTKNAVRNHANLVLCMVLVTLIGAGFSVYEGFCYSKLACIVYMAQTLVNILSILWYVLVGSKSRNKLIALCKSHQKDLWEFPQLVFQHICLLALIVVDGVAMQELGVLSCHGFKYLQYYSLYVQVVLMGSILRRIQGSLRLLDRSFTDSLSSFMVLPAGEMQKGEKGSYILTGWTKIALDSKANVTDALKVQGTLRRYKDIYLMVYYFNKLFKWVLPLLGLLVLLETVEALNAAFNDYKNVTLLVSKVLRSVTFYIFQLSLSLRFYSIADTAKEFEDTIYRHLLAMCESQITEAEQLITAELLSFWDYVLVNKLEFWAGPFKIETCNIYKQIAFVPMIILFVLESNL